MARRERRLLLGPAKAEQGEDVPIKANDHSLDAGRYAVKTTEALWRHRLLEAA